MRLIWEEEMQKSKNRQDGLLEAGNGKQKQAWRHRRGWGFTLVELMVVVAILSLLMAIVFPAVTGSKSTGTESQAGTDASSVQSGVDSFNNKSIQINQWPDEDLLPNSGGEYRDEFSTTVVLDLTFKDKDGVATTVSTSTHKALKWDATTNVWQSDGSVNSVTFVPSFVLSIPDSYLLKGDETKDLTANTINEFLWLLRVNQLNKDEESRTVEVYRLTEATIAGAALAAGDKLTYEQIY